MADPLVTVGVPTYNGSRYLRSTLVSLLDQDLEDFELVISDNGSDDDTASICRDLAAGDPRIRYHREPTNRGAGWNYNEVLARARGRYFKWAADDDPCEPTFLSRCVAQLEEDRSLVLSFPQTMLIDDQGDEMGPLDDEDLVLRSADPVARLARLLDHRVEWHPVFGVIRTEALRRTRGIGSFVYADIALLAELALIGQFGQVPERLFRRRYHDGRSLVANPGFVAHLAWYDPGLRTQRSALPNARLVRELLSCTWSADLSPWAHARAAQAVVRGWAVPHWRHIGGEVKMALRPARPTT